MAHLMKFFALIWPETMDQCDWQQHQEQQQASHLGESLETLQEMAGVSVCSIDTTSVCTVSQSGDLEIQFKLHSHSGLDVSDKTN